MLLDHHRCWWRQRKQQQSLPLRNDSEKERIFNHHHPIFIILITIDSWILSRRAVYLVWPATATHYHRDNNNLSPRYVAKALMMVYRWFFFLIRLFYYRRPLGWNYLCGSVLDFFSSHFFRFFKTTNCFFNSSSVEFVFVFFPQTFIAQQITSKYLRIVVSELYSLVGFLIRIIFFFFLKFEFESFRVCLLLNPLQINKIPYD